MRDSLVSFFVCMFYESEVILVDQSGAASVEALVTFGL